MHSNLVTNQTAVYLSPNPPPNKWGACPSQNYYQYLIWIRVDSSYEINIHLS